MRAGTVPDKHCKKCGDLKPLRSFYRMPGNKDGRSGKCKECTKADVRTNRNKHIEYYRAYDRARGNRQAPEYIKQYRCSNPDKYAAHIATNNAIRDGKLTKQPCEVCGTMKNIHAHHDDYSKPLDVRWLCAAHHRQWHRNNG